MLVCNYTAKESCIQVNNLCIHSQASCFIFVDKSESVVVNQVAGEVNPSVEVGFDICGTSLEPDFFVNQGKLRMHLNLSCVLQVYIAFAFKYCIK